MAQDSAIKTKQETPKTHLFSIGAGRQESGFKTGFFSYKPLFQIDFLHPPLLHWWSGLQSGCCALELSSHSPQHRGLLSSVILLVHTEDIGVLCKKVLKFIILCL